MVQYLHCYKLEVRMEVKDIIAEKNIREHAHLVCAVQGIGRRQGGRARCARLVEIISKRFSYRSAR